LSLKNLQREKTTRNGQDAWLLYTSQGQEVEAFTRFTESVAEYSPRTVKRYLEVAGRFLDYLYEARVFDTPPPTTRQLNAIVEAYPLLLRDGSTLTANRIREKTTSAPEDHWLADVATALNWSPLMPSSISSAIAGVNHFLALSESLSEEELSRASLLGLPHNDKSDGLIRTLQGTVAISSREVYRMRQNSMLGSVAKYAESSIRKPKRLRGSTGNSQEDAECKDFPWEHVPALIEAATSWRDKALWLLLAASGIRTSEARNLLLEDVLPEMQKVYVLDPQNRRFKPPKEVSELPRFKGRNLAATYLVPPIRQWFFDALEQYLKLEYVPSGNSYVFQYIEPTRRGQPLVNASDSTLAKSFKQAVHRAGIPLPFDGSVYTPHSLRHMYGVHMLNDYPLDPAAGRFGIPITDVQMLMGHAQLSSTQVYARAKRERLMHKLKMSDQALLHLSPTERLQLPVELSQRLGLSHD
jgi:integrase